MFQTGPHNTETETVTRSSKALSDALERLVYESYTSQKSIPKLFIGSNGEVLSRDDISAGKGLAVATVTYNIGSGRYCVFPGHQTTHPSIFFSDPENGRVSDGDLISQVTHLSRSSLLILPGSIWVGIVLLPGGKLGIFLKNGQKDIPINIATGPLVEFGRESVRDAYLQANLPIPEKLWFISTVQLTLEACPSRGKVIVYPGRLPPGAGLTIEARLAEAPFGKTTYLQEEAGFTIGSASTTLPKLVDAIAKLGTSTQKTEHLRSLLSNISGASIETLAKITKLTQGEPAKFLTTLGYRVKLTDITDLGDLRALFTLPNFNPDTRDFHLPRFNNSELQQANPVRLSAIADYLTAQYSSIFLHLALEQPPPQKKPS